jgi:hypothetical protein
MRLICIALLLTLTSCGSGIFSGVLDTVDDIETDECVTVKIYRDAFKRNKAVSVNVHVDGETVTK